MADDGEEQTNSTINESYSDDAGLNDGDFRPLVQESEQLPRLEFKSASEDPLAAVPDTCNESDSEAQPESCLPVASPGKLVITVRTWLS